MSFPFEVWCPLKRSMLHVAGRVVKLSTNLEELTVTDCELQDCKHRGDGGWDGRCLIGEKIQSNRWEERSK